MLKKQVKLFEDGGQVDPVSGNNVPLGSTEKEVRDDQPAMLSEGEMVVPADVVRYFGVEHFMKLRDEAKMGYKKMEAMGQFGTEEGQTLPDDALFNAGGPPFTVEDIEVIESDDLENLEGGKDEEIEAASGALVRNFAEGGSMIAPNMTAGNSIMSGTPLIPDVGREASLSNSQGLGQIVGSTGVGAFGTKYYMDPTGTVHQIFSMEGLAQETVPEDFIEIDSPFELRSYAELGGSVSKAAPSKKEEEEEIEEAGEDVDDTGRSEGTGDIGKDFSDLVGSISDLFGGDETATDPDPGPGPGAGGPGGMGGGPGTAAEAAGGQNHGGMGGGPGSAGGAAGQTGPDPSGMGGGPQTAEQASGGPDSDDGCVIATHAVSYGVFTQTEKAKAVIWCKQNLHNTWYGEAFRRGYRWHGNRAIAKGVKPTHYKEFNSFVNFVTGKKRTLKGSLTVCKRAVQFFVTGLFVKG